MFNNSNYVTEMHHKSVERFNDEQAKRSFKAKFSAHIENGMTKDTFTSKYACTEKDLQMFDELEAEIKHEQELGEAFLKGFNNATANNAYNQK